jgi:hypothetical protein
MRFAGILSPEDGYTIPPFRATLLGEEEGQTSTSKGLAFFCYFWQT